ncbi:MAG: glycosyltransferase family 4 protein [Lysobacterales bacterium]
MINQWLPPDPAPTAVLCGEVIDLLQAEGFEMVLLSRARGADGLGAGDGDTIRRIVIDRLVSGPTGIVAKLASWPTFAWRAWRLLRRDLQAGDVVIVCSDPPLFYPLAITAAGRAGARAIHWSQDVYPDVVQRYWPSSWLALALAPLRWLRNAALRRADQVVVISAGMGQLMQSAGARTTLIPNWARDDRLKARALGDSSLRRRHFADDEFVLAYSGNLGRVHEFDTLLAAAHQLRANPKVKFLIVGSGPRLALLQAIVATERLDSFSFLPLQPAAELADTLAAGDMHYVSLRPEFEGLVLPSKLYSIAAVGRGVLFCGDPEGESASLVADHHCGIAIEAGKGRELAAVIDELAADKARCAEFGAQARAMIEQGYSRDSAMGKWRGVLQALATETGAA